MACKESSHFRRTFKTAKTNAGVLALFFVGGVKNLSKESSTRTPYYLDQILGETNQHSDHALVAALGEGKT